MTDEPLLEVIPGGPLRVRGIPVVRLTRTVEGWITGDPLADPQGDVLICRCGRSGALPFCDAPPPHDCFDEEATSEGIVKPFTWDLPDPAEPAVALKPDGPIRVAGATPVRTPEGEVVDPGVRVSLCRCGASGAQPLCDGSHKVVGFREG